MLIVLNTTRLRKNVNIWQNEIFFPRVFIYIWKYSVFFTNKPFQTISCVITENIHANLDLARTSVPDTIILTFTETYHHNSLRYECMKFVLFKSLVES